MAAKGLLSIGRRGLLLAAFICADASAQSGRSDPVAAFPARPIRILVPSTPAGASDFLARLIGSKLSEVWHQQVVNGVLAPGKTPKEIIAKLHGEIAKILHSPEIEARLASFGFKPVGNTPAQFAAMIQSEMQKWEKLIKEAGINPQLTQ